MTDSPSDFRLRDVQTVVLGVAALPPAIAFYRDVLGLSLRAQFEGFAFLEAGGITLTLSEGLQRAMGPASGAVEVVFSVADVSLAHAPLSARGVRFRQEPRVADGKNWVASFSDPDGHLLSIFGPHSGS